jgi:hypothetical protein
VPFVVHELRTPGEKDGWDTLRCAKLDMKTAAFGFRMHSGWGILVAVSGDTDLLEVVLRSRIVVIDASLPGGKQPYHYAAELSLDKSEQHISKCSAISEALALATIRVSLRELNKHQYRVTSSAVLMASGRALPSLPEILASHPLIHTAEGEFFRNVAIKACDELKIPVTQIRERELEEGAKSAFGKSAAQVTRKISAMGASLGPPWTADHKAAALAALLTLKNR